jgi:hypothetical protein
MDTLTVGAHATDLTSSLQASESLSLAACHIQDADTVLPERSAIDKRNGDRLDRHRTVDAPNLTGKRVPVAAAVTLRVDRHRIHVIVWRRSSRTSVDLPVPISRRRRRRPPISSMPDTCSDPCARSCKYCATAPSSARARHQPRPEGHGRIVSAVARTNRNGIVREQSLALTTVLAILRLRRRRSARAPARLVLRALRLPSTIALDRLAALLAGAVHDQARTVMSARPDARYSRPTVTSMRPTPGAMGSPLP